MFQEDLIFILNNQKIQLPVLAVIFRQKEHEFARIAIAIPESCKIIPTSLQIKDFFNGIFYSIANENKHKWIVFLAASQKNQEISNADLLFCDPWSHKIIQIGKNNTKHTLAQVIQYHQNINNNICQDLFIQINNFVTENWSKTRKLKIIIPKNTDNQEGKDILNFLSDLKASSKQMTIEINEFNYIVQLYYTLEVNIFYNLNKCIEIYHPEAYGEQTILQDLEHDEIENKCKRMTHNLKGYIKIPLNIFIQIGNIIEYQDLIGQVVFVEHVITNQDRYTKIQILINNYKDMKLTYKEWQILKKKRDYIPLIADTRRSVHTFNHMEHIIKIKPKEIQHYSVQKPLLNDVYNLFVDYSFA